MWTDGGPCGSGDALAPLLCDTSACSDAEGSEPRQPRDQCAPGLAERLISRRAAPPTTRTARPGVSDQGGPRQVRREATPVNSQGTTTPVSFPPVGGCRGVLALPVPGRLRLVEAGRGVDRLRAGLAGPGPVPADVGRACARHPAPGHVALELVPVRAMRRIDLDQPRSVCISRGPSSLERLFDILRAYDVPVTVRCRCVLW